MSSSQQQFVREQFRVANLDQTHTLYRAVPLIKALAPITTMASGERDRVLRNHRIVAIRDKQEIYLRQTLDDLLHMCGVLNAGWCAGALSEQEPRIPADLRALLKLKEVRAYFGERYPLHFMPAFLKRAGGNLPRSHRFEPGWFAALLRLDANFRDSQLTDFLLVVDGYRLASRTVHFGVLRDAVRDGARVVEAITTPREHRDRLQSVIAGAERFLVFCDDLQELLDAASDQIDMQEAAFHLYHYWFAVRGESLNDIMNCTLLALKQLDSGELVENGAIQHSITTLFKRAQDYSAN